MTRQRLTITLKKDLLKLVDGLVDGQKVRNRSHAIETLLSQELLAPQTRVLILAGGRGVNFRPLTYELPKAMIPVGGKPLLAHTLQQLHSQRYDDVTLSVGHLGKRIRDYFGDGSDQNLNISYLEQKGLKVGTAQPLLQAKNGFSGDPFILWYGDVLADINLADLLAFHRNQNGAIATVALTSVEKVGMWGVVKLMGNRILEFVEKPKQAQTKSHLVNSGIYVLDPKIFKYIGKSSVSFERDILPRLAEEGKLYGYPFEGNWYDVSTPEVYGEVVKQFKKS